MSANQNLWALILAAGDGRRLRALTTTQGGVTVPKQFCALERGPSLLQEALSRAARVTVLGQVYAIVAVDHRRWWTEQLESLPCQNIIEQPRNRGTANGILLPLLHILERDPDARIVLLPSDHHVRDEGTLARSLREAAAREPSSWAEIVLLGLKPRQPDPELGYIIPGRDTGDSYREVERFVEKPPVELACELTDRGALWNAFIIAADGQALLKLFERRCPEVVRAMRDIMAATSAGPERLEALAQLYDELAVLDFSTNILQGHEQHLRVATVPECGWSDLGTPQRVAEALHGIPQTALRARQRSNRGTVVSLAAQHRRLREAPFYGPDSSAAV